MDIEFGQLSLVALYFKGTEVMTEKADNMTETISELLSCPLFVGKPKAGMKARTINRQNGKPNVFQRLSQLFGG